jgi:hypothetical protein
MLVNPLLVVRTLLEGGQWSESAGLLVRWVQFYNLFLKNQSISHKKKTTGGDIDNPYHYLVVL